MAEPDEDEVRQVAEPEHFVPYQVVIPWPSLAERFEEWVRSQGWNLSPRLLFGTKDDEVHTRFIQPPLPSQMRLPEPEPYRIEETCCGKCPGGTCYVDQVTGA